MQCNTVAGLTPAPRTAVTAVGYRGYDYDYGLPWQALVYVACCLDTAAQDVALLLGRPACHSDACEAWGGMALGSMGRHGTGEPALVRAALGARIPPSMSRRIFPGEIVGRSWGHCFPPSLVSRCA